MQLNKKNESNNDYPVYWWRKNAWVNILEQRSHVLADNNSFWVYGFGKHLYMNNYKQRYVLKWDPAAADPSIAVVAKTSNPSKPVPVVTGKTEPVKPADTKPIETQIKQVGD
ncbi:MAG: hypothetical protein IPP99_16425 [Chitinophagaceae bacterium]|nr:hypothetical protein [Chitinophagaceae bacterium]